VIVLQINIDGVLAIESKRKAPVAGHIYRVRALALPLQWMQAIAGQIHVFGMCRSVQSVQQSLNSRRPISRYTAVIALGKEQLKPSMAETAYHDSLSCIA
jgi:hypothetical protein